MTVEHKYTENTVVVCLSIRAVNRLFIKESVIDKTRNRSVKYHRDDQYIGCNRDSITKKEENSIDIFLITISG